MNHTHLQKQIFRQVPTKWFIGSTKQIKLVREGLSDEEPKNNNLISKAESNIHKSSIKKSKEYSICERFFRRVSNFRDITIDFLVQ